jgi:hypothetical protein
MAVNATSPPSATNKRATNGVRYRLPPFSRRRILADAEDGHEAAFALAESQVRKLR